MLFASASGLDPHISPEAALLQVKRIARARNFNKSQKQKLHELIRENTEKRQFCILGGGKNQCASVEFELDGIK